MRNLLNNDLGKIGCGLINGMSALAIVLMALCMFRGIMVNDDTARLAATIQGYSNVKVVDHSWFAVGLRGCSGGDAARFTVKATNLAGKDVQFYVCSGWLFKGATIRTK